ncbi:universal stress protein [Actinoplanes sp. NPDC049596]|uniref:universal stress protein n=1 Tax=unclassified Actinoplanes TaxID=2626549 RepID=UPI00341CC142
MDGRRSARVLAGYDGTPAAKLALEVASALLPCTHAWVTCLWTTLPDAAGAAAERLIAVAERDAEVKAHRLASAGLAVARSNGWSAEPWVERGHGAVGRRLAELAGKLGPDLVLVGTSGAGGVACDVVRFCFQPVLVVCSPLPVIARAALREGPVLVGCDGSVGAERAREVAGRLFDERRLVTLTVPHARRSGGSLAPVVAETLATGADRERAAVVVVGAPRSALTAAVLRRITRPLLVVS